MEAKWPFLLLTISLLIGLGVMIVRLDRVNVIRNWQTRRCDIPVMFASSFFKPDDDRRTTSEFASANFEFCMKSRIEKFMEVMMAPVYALFSKHTAVVGSSMDSMNLLRKIAATMYQAFSGYLDTFYRRFNASIFEISKVVQFLRMAMGRISGIMLSMVYTGLSVFNGMINAIQFVMKVVMIIATILLVLFILLFFIMFPVIPIIIYALVTVIKGANLLTGYMSPSIAAEANDKKAGFCFAEWTQITVVQDGVPVIKSVKDIVCGDQLLDGGYITAVIQMDGSEVDLFIVNDMVYVSGDHLLRGTDHVWKSVSVDERAVKTHRRSSFVYCFNTTTNVIPIAGLDFRDWEEIANEDEKGQMVWNYTVSSIMNYGIPFSQWKENLKPYVNTALLGSNVLIKTPSGFVPIHTIRVNDYVVDARGYRRAVLGLIRGEVEYSKEESRLDWITELYEYHPNTGVWLKGRATVMQGSEKTEGLALITEHGEYIIWNAIEEREVRVRDFTEVGYDVIYKTYPYVDARLRMKE
jgi:hypothetical protein